MKYKLSLIIIIFSFFIYSKDIYAITLDYIYEIKPSIKCIINRDLNNDIRPMQGVYINDDYAVYAGYQSETSPTIITLVDLNSCVVIDKNNDKVMGHANDIVFNNYKYYVTSGLNDKNLYSFQIVNRKIVLDNDPIKTKIKASAIDFNKINHKYYSYIDGKLYQFPSLDAEKTEYKLLGETPTFYDNIDNGSTSLVKQGISVYNDNIYFARTVSNKNSSYYNDSFVLVFDANTGQYKYSMHFPSSHFSGHLEGITVLNNKIYFGLNVHASPQKQAFLVYDGINEIENKYHSTIKSSRLIQSQDTIIIYEKNKIDLSMFTIEKIYIDGSVEKINLNENNAQVFDFDNKKIGKQTITIRYNDKDYKVIVNVVKKKELSRNLVVEHDIDILEGHNFIYEGIYILVKYNNGEEKKINLTEKNSNISKFNNKKIGKQEVIIEYDNKKYKCTVNIKRIPKISINIMRLEINSNLDENIKPDVKLDQNSSYYISNSMFTKNIPNISSIDFNDYYKGTIVNGDIIYIVISLKDKDNDNLLEKENIIINYANHNISDFEYEKIINNNEVSYILVFSQELNETKLDNNEIKIDNKKMKEEKTIVKKEDTPKKSKFIIILFIIPIILVLLVSIILIRKKLHKKIS